MKKAGFIALLVATYFLALVILLPSRFVIQFAAVPENIQLGGVSGSIWRGQVDIVIVDDIALRDVSWKVRPLSLLRGAVVADIEVSDHLDNIAFGQGRVEAGFNQLKLKNLYAEARLADLAAFSPEPSPFPVRGDVEVQVTEFSYGQPVCDVLDGNIQLRGGAVQVGENWEELGSLRAQLGCTDGQLTAQLDEPNNLGLSASVEVNFVAAQGEYQITQSADAPRTIRNIVAMLPEQARQRQRFTVRFQ